MGLAQAVPYGARRWVRERVPPTVWRQIRRVGVGETAPQRWVRRSRTGSAALMLSARNPGRPARDARRADLPRHHGRAVPIQRRVRRRARLRRGRLRRRRRALLRARRAGRAASRGRRTLVGASGGDRGTGVGEPRRHRLRRSPARQGHPLAAAVARPLGQPPRQDDPGLPGARQPHRWVPGRTAAGLRHRVLVGDRASGGPPRRTASPCRRARGSRPGRTAGPTSWCPPSRTSCSGRSTARDAAPGDDHPAPRAVRDHPGRRGLHLGRRQRPGVARAQGRGPARSTSPASRSSTSWPRNESRFTSRDELRYSLRSLDMYADWVRHVYLVTDDQVPDVARHHQPADHAWSPP